MTPNPYAAWFTVWKEAFGGYCPGYWAKTFKQLTLEHGDAALGAWKTYCEANKDKGKYNPSVFKFARCVGTWLPQEKSTDEDIPTEGMRL